jgi:glutamyl-tRNA synthetase
MHITNDKIDTNVETEDKDYIKTALEHFPKGEVTPDTWGEWTTALKDATDRKGKSLFMPLRQALTGMSHGPEMDKMLLLLGRDRAVRRLDRASA